MSDNYGAYCKSCKVRQPSCCGLCTVCVSELEAKLQAMSDTCPNCGFTCSLAPREKRRLEARITELEAENEAHIRRWTIAERENAKQAIKEAE